MNRLQISLEIFHQSMRVLGKHPRLLWFPLINFVGLAIIMVFFLIPIFVTLPEATRQMFFQGLKNFGQSDYRSVVMIGWYIATMFVVTFTNVIFYSEVLHAFNGDQVSILRGLNLALGKLQAIMVWSLLSGIVGGLIRKLEENVGIIGRWVLALLGISWSVASVFAIPVMIREQNQSDPITFLKYSGRLVRKTWGETAFGIIGMGVLGFLVFVLILVGGIAITITITSGMFLFEPRSTGLGLYIPAGIALTVLTSFLSLYLLSLLNRIYICGLYIYACEGVIPAEFDETLFSKAWKIKNQNLKV